MARMLHVFRSNRVDLSSGKVLDTEWWEEFMEEHKPRTAPIVIVGNQDFYRLHIGVSVSVVQLEELGLTLSDLNGYVSKKVAELGAQTRLTQSCEPEADGEWKYRYLVTQEPDTHLIYGRESVDFKTEEVFDNYLVFSPVK